MVITLQKPPKKVASPPRHSQRRSATKADAPKPSKPHWSDQPPWEPKGIISDVMDREQWEPIHVADVKSEAIKWTHYLFEEVGRCNPSIFNLKSYPRECRKRGNKMFDYLHQMVRRQLQASQRKRKARAFNTQPSATGASVKYSSTASDGSNEVGQAPNGPKPEQDLPPKRSDCSSSKGKSPGQPSNSLASDDVIIPITKECKPFILFHFLP